MAFNALTGSSFFFGSGDSGAIANPEDVRDVDNATMVGGTVLTMNGSGGSYSSEVAWPGSGGSILDAGFDGGGILLPTYQQGVATAADHGSGTFRNLPDVSMVADNTFDFITPMLTPDGGAPFLLDAGLPGTGQGTSFASPLWAGFAALVNQRLQQSGSPLNALGFINPTVYAIGQNQGLYAASFHDIVSGVTIATGPDGGVTSEPGYPATVGYDLATGLGSPSCFLIDQLASSSPTTCACGATPCVDLLSDPNNCGSCGNLCGSGATCCAGTCANLQSSPGNCGACGTVCGSGVCNSGTCTACPSGDVVCGSACSNPQTDSANCGSCNHGCGSGSCNAGQCTQWQVASQTGYMYGLATDGTYVAWGLNAPSASADGVYSVAAGGSATGATPQQLSSSVPGVVTPGNGGAIAVGAGSVLWATSSSGGAVTISSVAEGAAASTMTSSTFQVGGSAFALAANGSHVYFGESNGTPNSLFGYSCSLPGSSGGMTCSAINTQADVGSSGPAAFSFFPFDGSIFAELLVGSASAVEEVQLALPSFSGVLGSQGPLILAMAADSQNAYWVNSTFPADAAPPSLSLVSAPLLNISSATPTTLASLNGGVIYGPLASDASDGTKIYLATVQATNTTPTGPSTIGWVPTTTSGSSLTTIYNTQYAILNLQAVGGFLYWVEYQNSDVNPVATIYGRRFP